MSDGLDDPEDYASNESRISCIQLVLDLDGLDSSAGAERVYRRCLIVAPIVPGNFMGPGGDREADELNFVRIWLPRMKPNV